MHVFMALWILLVAAAPYLVDKAMLAHADRTTVHLFTPEAGKQASGVVIGEKQTDKGCRVLVGTSRHVITEDEEDGRKPTPVALGSVDGPKAIAGAWSESGDAGVVEFFIHGECEHNAYGVAIVAADPVERGQKVFGSGYPVGRSFFSWGTISQPVLSFDESDGATVEYISAVYPGAPGNSGGPLFDIYGRVVGLLSGGYPKAPLLTFFATAAQLREAAAKLPCWSI